MEQDSAPLTLRDYLAPVIARRWMILAVVVVAIVGGYVYGAHKQPVYTATTELYVGQNGNAAIGVGASYSSQRTVADEAALVTTTEVGAIVARQIGYHGSPGSLVGAVTATPSATADVVNITAQESNPDLAARVANAFAKAFIQLSTQQGHQQTTRSMAELRRQLKQDKGAGASSERANILSQIQQLQVAQSSGVGAATQVDPASPPASSSTKPAWEYALLAGIACLVAMVILAYMLQRLDPRVKTVMHAIEIYDRPVLATVTEDAEVTTHLENDRPALSSATREVFRELRINLELSAPDEGMKTLVVTSASPGEGKSTIARNVALAFAEVGRRVALVDADLRKPTLVKVLATEGEAGITEVVAGMSALEDVVRHVPVAASGNVGVGDFRITGTGEIVEANGNGDSAGQSEVTLTLVPAGRKPPNPPAILESHAFKDLLRQLSESHDIVILDTPPLTVVSDVIPILGAVDALLLVVRSGVTDARSARHAAEIIARVPEANFVGIAVNGLPVAEAAAYGSGYGYGYYRGGYGYGTRKPGLFDRRSGGRSGAGVS